MTKRYVLYLDHVGESVYVLDVFETHNRNTPDIYRRYHEQYPALQGDLVIVMGVWYEYWSQLEGPLFTYVKAKDILMNHKESSAYPHGEWPNEAEVTF